MLCLLMHVGRAAELTASLFGAVCNDGSPYAYYVKTNAGSDNWVFFQMGGSYCWDQPTCTRRKSTMGNLMTSKMLAPQVTINYGILSDIPANNPPFAAWNRVLLPYCTSDAYSGNLSSSAWDAGLSFLGSRVLPAVVADLKAHYGLLDQPSSTIVYSGASAGGVGIYPNVDRISEELLPAARVFGVVDSGWFLDSTPFVTQQCGDDPNTCTDEEIFSSGIPAWGAIMDASCAAATPVDIRWECLLGYRVLPYLSTPLFVFQWQFDLAQLTHDGVKTKPSTMPELAYAQASAANLTKTFTTAANATSRHRFFSASCYQHVVLNSKHEQAWITLTVNGMTLVDAIGDFIDGHGGNASVCVDTCNTPDCNPTCPVLASKYLKQ
eukprot:CAMPEP_0115877516 /NCGR_PEP_ID=MMETSP0287-20121206/26265_1 /TAXON_ID=412157 /ORGANISM="Chrysochromulina rotalis, Strain UIO044" /LENGTH=379 /DNA_ID=CAMNT_0003333037 /DNA_START=250 /DNA_END=1390 /DNA_ORIENTATION=+